MADEKRARELWCVVRGDEDDNWGIARQSTPYPYTDIAQMMDEDDAVEVVELHNARVAESSKAKEGHGSPETEVHSDWGHPPESYCKQCGATYSRDWSGTTCTVCDGDIVKAKEGQTAPPDYTRGDE